ncbi:branched-chain amino acid transport system ATP-binding protein [Azospirillum lipoferum]|uniref:ABC transporter ATP-binding protein n=1 Tax=Azospirillum lipoferum TaxID=193 RepID=A0A5A9GL59_AZOLI|nr:MULTISPECIES: ABC transporter ATP-binding protein [Azospirillum]KAA0594555.1 ABC transporter ATP-binding protein [Azospirillum lipoferum]MCP1613314.1 branched-chain amino acid transport system ATP-binding protein [Azospirillum lipoferum]MDW5531514.1 ABC transporter ATP-binding protein [Azospirillum sp. NL1]
MPAVLSEPLFSPAAGAVSSALAVEALSLSFGGVTALSEVSFAVAPGEIRAVIGPNGAGKSSLLNVVSGLYRPDRGRVWLGGHSFASVPTDRLATLGVSRTFQNLALFKGLSVLDNVAAGLSHRLRAGVFAQVIGLPAARRERAEGYARAEELLAFLHLDGVRDRPAGTLPYGMQKRVELARALVARPRLLLLDEPMAGMTLTEKRDLSGHIRAARDDLGTTIVLIEHDVGVVMGLSDRIAVLDYGRLIADGTPDEIRNDPVVIDAYLGVAHDLEAGEGI